jgi:hypothetical protein
MMMPDQPWENVLTFTMVTVLSAIMLGMLWYFAISHGAAAWQWLNLLGLTAVALRFAVPRIRSWLRRAR